MLLLLLIVLLVLLVLRVFLLLLRWLCRCRSICRCRLLQLGRRCRCGRCSSRLCLLFLRRLCHAPRRLCNCCAKVSPHFCW